MKRFILATLFAVVFTVGVGSSEVGASSLRIQPLDYKFALKKNESKKGFVDITNASAGEIDIRFSVQAFKQVDDKGSLKFYDNSEITKGIELDIEETSLRSGETLRLFFVANASTLPAGDVFAAIFATESSADSLLDSQVVRVGTLLSIENQRPGSRRAVIEKLDINFFQFGNGITGSYRIKNAAEKGENTAFYPESTVKIAPFSMSQKLTSGLVFSGHSRTNQFSVEASRLGFYDISLSYDASSQVKKVFMVTGYYRPLMVAVVTLIFIGVSIFLLHRHLRT